MKTRREVIEEAVEELGGPCCFEDCQEMIAKGAAIDAVEAALQKWDSFLHHQREMEKRYKQMVRTP